MAKKKKYKMSGALKALAYERGRASASILAGMTPITTRKKSYTGKNGGTGVVYTNFYVGKGKAAKSVSDFYGKGASGNYYHRRSISYFIKGNKKK